MNTLSERLASSGISRCNLLIRSLIWASVISDETPDCLEPDLLLDIVKVYEEVGVSEMYFVVLLLNFSKSVFEKHCLVCS